MRRQLGPILMSALLLSACGPAEEAEGEDQLIRGLKVFEVRATADSEARRYPSIVRPAEESKLSFEVDGRLKEITLEVGQRITRGDTLAEIQPVSLELQVQQSKAALDEAESAFKNAEADYKRKEELLKSGFVTQAAFDQSSSTLNSTAAQVEQAKKQLDIATENLGKSKLIAPFDGVVSSVDVESFSQVSPGQTVLGLYSESAFEIAFTVPAAIINAVSVGDGVTVNVTDLAGTSGLGRTTFPGHISEVGSRAATVSGFPVVATFDEKDDRLKAGMSADVNLNIALEGAEEGYLIPVSSFAFGLGDAPGPGNATGQVYVFEEGSGTVQSREIRIVGIKENMVIVSEGIAAGDLVAAAGVSYLRDGQRVKLLPLDQ